jgi:hypothetical protein
VSVDPFATAEADWKEAVGDPAANGAAAGRAPALRHPQLGEPVAVYEYKRLAGDVAFVVCRFAPKDFRPAHLASNGRWAWNLNGAPPLLYRLADVERALQAGETVWIVDGEKDADALAAAGVCATCCARSQGWTVELAEQLTGARRVRIVADRDGGAGAMQARQVAALLVEAAAMASSDIELVQAADGKDAHDHLAAGRSLDEFVPLELGTVEDVAVPQAAEPFVGLTHDEALLLDLPTERQLIRDLVPIGAIGTIAGVPETYKSWLAQSIAIRVAQGHGTVLGCEVTCAVAVGYFWQDDSTREEAERIKVFQAVHEAPAGLPLRWFLNKGLQLPADLARLVTTIHAHTLGLVVLDSFYNFLPGIDLKDEGAEQIVATLKREVADATGCTVLIVDHMPWATDTNRQRLRAYGGVFKNAATRFGIYIDANGNNLHIEARGNNIRGFKKHPAYWDNDTLELRLIEAGDHDEKVEQKAEQIAALLEAEPPKTYSTTAIRKAVKGGNETVDQALRLLTLSGRVQTLPTDDPAGSGSPGRSKGWYASIHTGLNTPSALPLDTPAGFGRVEPGHQAEHPAAPPIGGQGSRRQGQKEPESTPAEDFPF